MTVTTRSAELRDVPALVRLRDANAEHHVRLGPAIHRRPAADAVHAHFADRLRDGPDDLLILAETDGVVAGLAEIVLRPDPPEHQILIPVRTADVHTVILDGFRGRGVGSVLLAAAEDIARGRGVEALVAVVFAPNEAAARFYTAAGYGPHGLLLRKPLAPPPR